MPAQHMLSILAKPDITGIRTAELFEQEHTVIPAVVLVEGVLWPANAPSPELALAEEFGRFPDGWNGRPVVFDHPRIDGIAVSASSPDVLEVNSFGQLFNTKLVGTKLKTEIWINTARVDKLPKEGQDTVAALLDGQMVEVSTGLFTMSEMIKGKFEGQDYEAIWRNIVPDHLAVLPLGVTGACSIEDGCGAPRANNMKPVMRAAQLNPAANAGTNDCACKQLPTAEDLSMLQKFVGWCTNTLSVTTSADTTEFVPVMVADGDTRVNSNSNIQENAMSRKELVDGLIANTATKFTEEDRDWLTALEDGQFDRLAPVEASADDAPNGPGGDNGGEQPTAAAAKPKEPAPPVAAKPVSTDDYIANAPEEVRQVLNSGLRMHRSRKKALIDALVANGRCKWSAEQLDKRDLDELENLVALSGGDFTYEGNGANLSANSGADDDAPPPPPQVFVIGKKADAA